jgi:hypothetical protein
MGLSYRLDLLLGQSPEFQIEATPAIVVVIRDARVPGQAREQVLGSWVAFLALASRVEATGADSAHWRD